MKIIWKNKKRSQLLPTSNLTFTESEERSKLEPESEVDTSQNSTKHHRTIPELADSFQSQGNSFAEVVYFSNVDLASFFLKNFVSWFLKEGKYREALGKWEGALTLVPGKAILHEQKAQVLLEIGDAWAALKAATSEQLTIFNFFTLFKTESCHDSDYSEHWYFFMFVKLYGCLILKSY